MSVVQFLRIFWARRMLILWSTVAVVVGAVIVCMILPPRWQATSRVILNVGKPDPVTGQVMSANLARSYFGTQMGLVTDYAVAGQVADRLGWLSDPRFIQAYENRPANDKRDFRRFVAQQVVIQNTTVDMVTGGSAIMEINYTATNPRDAKLVADALRDAYIDANREIRMRDAERDAAWFAKRVETARQALEQAQDTMVAFERDNGIVMADEKTDMDTARLQTLARAGAAKEATLATPGPTPAAIQIAQVDGQIADALKTLGPNHPDVVALKEKRKSLEPIAAKELSAQQKTIADITNSSTDGALARQSQKVVAKGDKIARLNQLAADVELRREEFNQLTQKLIALRQQAAIGVTEVSPLGSAIVPAQPTFPNWLLIIPGALVIGLAVGVLLALILEFFAHRVRCVDDMKGLIDAPLIGVIAAPSRARRQWWRPFRPAIGYGQGRA